MLVLSAWVSIIILFMVLASTINIEILFVLWLIGLLVIIELTGSVYIRPGYLKNINIITAIAVSVFGMIVIFKILEIIAK